MATAHVAELFGLHWSTVRMLDQRRLEAAVAALPEATPRRLVMDEFALYKGHRYASVVRTPIPGASCGSARAAAGRRFGRSLRPWARRAARGSRR